MESVGAAQFKNEIDAVIGWTIGMSKRLIVVPTDFSTCSTDALEFVVNTFNLTFHDTIVLLHCFSQDPRDSLSALDVDNQCLMMIKV